MNRLKQAIGNVYITVREILWASPLVRWSLTVNMIIWLGYVSRRLLRLAPQEDAIGLVRGHRMWFGPGSECYLDMTRGTWEPEGADEYALLPDGELALVRSDLSTISGLALEAIRQDLSTIKAKLGF